VCTSNLKCYELYINDPCYWKNPVLHLHIWQKVTCVAQNELYATFSLSLIGKQVVKLVGQKTGMESSSVTLD